MVRMLQKSLSRNWLKSIILVMVLSVSVGLWFGLARQAAASEQTLQIGKPVPSALIQAPNVLPAEVHAPSSPPPNQSSRDIGPIRVWADSFVDGSTITASGNVSVGSVAANEAFFKISGSASWSASGTMTLQGTLTIFAADIQLGLGTFTVNTTTGDVTWAPSNQVLYSNVGDSELQISPIITLNVVQPQVTMAGEIVVALAEGQELRTNVSFTVGADGSISGGATTNINLKLAGGTLTGAVTVGTEGLSAQNVQYTLPGIGAVTLHELVIDGKGPLKFHFGATATFPVPDLNLGDNVLVLTDLQATLGLTVTDQSPTPSYMLALTGKLNLAGLPQNGSVAVDAFGLSISDGVVAGSVENLTVSVAGKSLTLEEASFEQKIFQNRGVEAVSYELIAGTATWDLPSSWTGAVQAQVSLSNVALLTEAPYIRIGGAGASFTSDKEFYLGGDANSNASVRFDQLQGSFNYNSAGNSWAVTVGARVTFKLGQDSAEFTGVAITIENGQASASIANATLKMAGLELIADNLNYADTEFTADNITLKLPQAWGNNSVSVSGLRITKDGVEIGGAGGSFAIPDQTLGDVLKLKDMSAEVSISGQRNYSITINATIEINKVRSSSGGNSASATGSLTIANGRVSGSISALSFELVGLKFSATDAQFVDNRLTVGTVNLTLPSSLGGASTTIFGLEIGGSAGFKIQGGEFRLPDFTMAGVGVQNAHAEFNRLSDGTYVVGAGAKLNLTNFSIEGEFTIAVNSATNTVGLRHVFLAFESNNIASAIPLGNTGFFLTRVSGTFDMDDNTLRMGFSVRATMAMQVAGKGLLDLNGTVNVQVRPTFDFRSSASASLLGFNLASVDLHITKSKFELDAQLNAGIINATLEIAFGRDAQNEFTFYGAMRAGISIPKGKFVNRRIIKIPPRTINLGTVSLDGGKFKHDNQTVWGGRFSGRIFGVSFFVFAKVSPGVGIDIGTRMSEYQPVLPAVRPAFANLRPNDDLYEIEVTGETAELTLVEGIETVHRRAPTNLTVIAPNGAQFQQTITYTETDGSYRIYSIVPNNPTEAVGTWTVITEPGNELVSMATVPMPEVESFSACLDGGPCLDANTAEPLTVELGQTIDMSWSTSVVTPGLKLEVYAEDSEGNRRVIAGQDTETGTELADSTTWSPKVPAGLYTVTLQLEDRENGTTIAQKQVLNLIDTHAPAAPASLQAFPFEDGSVHLVWNSTAMEQDVVGFYVTVNGNDTRLVEERTGEHTLYGLELGETHTIEVKLYDRSGNIGTTASTQITLSEMGVTNIWPPRDTQKSMIGRVDIAFNRPVVVDSFTVSTAEGVVAGSFVQREVEQSVGEIVSIGGIFTPTSGRLPLGVYSAIVQAHDAETGETMTVEWPFEIVAPAINVYLPIIKR